jgi:hypothetical protein
MKNEQKAMLAIGNADIEWEMEPCQPSAMPQMHRGRALCTVHVERTRLVDHVPAT